MSRLADLKAAIDAGKTAQLRCWRSILRWLVKKEPAGYVKQGEGYTNPRGIVVVQAETTCYPEWDRLLNAFEEEADSEQGEITDRPLEPYEPPERSRK